MQAEKIDSSADNIRSALNAAVSLQAAFANRDSEPVDAYGNEQQRGNVAPDGGEEIDQIERWDGNPSDIGAGDETVGIATEAESRSRNEPSHGASEPIS